MLLLALAFAVVGFVGGIAINRWQTRQDALLGPRSVDLSERELTDLTASHEPRHNTPRLYRAK